MNFPAILTRPDQNSTIHSPTAMQTKGDDYNRNPVGTGPFIVKSWTAGDRMVVERNPNYWNKGKPHLDRVVLRPLPDAQSRFASLVSGETDVVWADEYEADNIARARKNAALKVLDYTGSGAGGRRHQHQGAAARRRAGAPGADHGARPAEAVAGPDQRPRQAGEQSLRRGLVGQVQGRRRAADRSQEGRRADQGVRQAGAVQDAVHGDAARPRQRPGDAAALEADRRRHGDRAGRPGDLPAARLPAQVRHHRLAHRRLPRSRQRRCSPTSTARAR